MANTTKKLRITLKNVTLSFANIFTPKAFNGGAPRYSGSFLINKEDTENVNKVKSAIKDVIIAEWKEDRPKFKDNQYCLRDGDNESWDGYQGCYFVSAGNQEKFPPVIKDLDGTNLRQAGIDYNVGDKPQSGDTVNVVLDIWAQNNNYGKRINATLIGIQFVKAGKRFTPKSMDDDLFSDTIVAKNEEVRKEEDTENPFEEVKAEKPKLAFGIKKPSPETLEKKSDEIDDLFDASK